MQTKWILNRRKLGTFFHNVDLLLDRAVLRKWCVDRKDKKLFERQMEVRRSLTLPKADKVNANHAIDFDVRLLVKFRLRLVARRTQGDAEAIAEAAMRQIEPSEISKQVRIRTKDLSHSAYHVRRSELVPGQSP